MLKFTSFPELSWVIPRKQQEGMNNQKIKKKKNKKQKKDNLTSSISKTRLFVTFTVNWWTELSGTETEAPIFLSFNEKEKTFSGAKAFI